MKILITGASGQLGLALQHALSSHEVVALNRAALDVADKAAVPAAIKAARPDLVINCAAWTDTLAAERDPDAAMFVNGVGPFYIAQSCLESGSAMAQISSNEVFDGSKGSPYTEEDFVDTMDAVNRYGGGKAVAEKAVAETLPQYYIVRTSWLYGPGRESFPEKILKAAREQGKLRVVTDEIASPTLTTDLAAAIARLIETRAYGTYHLTNAGECSRFEWAEEVLRLAGVEVPIEATTQAEYGSPVRKPVNSTLANHRAAALGITLRPWRDALREHMRATAGARA